MSNLLREKRWSDFDNGLRIDTTGNVVINYGEEAIESSIENILSTMKYSRVRSKLGSSIYSLMFEPISEEAADDIKDAIEDNVTEFDNRISALIAVVTPYEDENYYEIKIRFKENDSLSYREIISFLEGRAG